IDGVLYGCRLHDLGHERAGDTEVKEAAYLVCLAGMRDAQLHGDAQLFRRPREADQMMIAVRRVLRIQPDQLALAMFQGTGQLLLAPGDVSAQGDQLVAGGDACAQIGLRRHVSCVLVASSQASQGTSTSRAAVATALSGQYGATAWNTARIC